MSAALIHFLNKDLFRTEEFTANGNFTVPKGVTNVIVIGWGGGGGGAGGTNSAGSGEGGDGGAGAMLGVAFSAVTSEAVLPVVIGAGGTAGPGGNINNSGGNGQNSTFNGITFVGGTGGQIATERDRLSGPVRGGIGEDSSPSTAAQAGDRSAFFTGGAAGTDGGSGTSVGGGGAAGPGGGGAAGANSPAPSGAGVNGNSAAANTGAGGGGGSEADSGTGGNGGAGGSGKIIIAWVEPN